MSKDVQFKRRGKDKTGAFKKQRPSDMKRVFVGKKSYVLVQQQPQADSQQFGQHFSTLAKKGGYSAAHAMTGLYQPPPLRGQQSNTRSAQNTSRRPANTSAGWSNSKSQGAGRFGARDSAAGVKFNNFLWR